MVTDFSAAEKDSGVKLCMLVRLLSGMSFSHFGELWLAWSHGGGITSGLYTSTHWCHAAAPGEARNWVPWLGSVVQSELGKSASRKAVWWDLCLASLLTHFFLFFLPAFFFSYYRLDLNFVYNWSYIFTGRMALMSPKQQNQSTNGSSKYQLQPGKITNTGLSFLDPQTDSRQSALFCV